jgi:hypothetical protein
VKPSHHLASMSRSGVLAFGCGEESGLLALDEGCVARSGAVVLSRAAVGIGIAHGGACGLTMRKSEVQRTCEVPVSLSVPVRRPGVGSVARHSLNDVDGVEVNG